MEYNYCWIGPKKIPLGKTLNINYTALKMFVKIEMLVNFI